MAKENDDIRTAIRTAAKDSMSGTLDENKPFLEQFNNQLRIETNLKVQLKKLTPSIRLLNKHFNDLKGKKFEPIVTWLVDKFRPPTRGQAQPVDGSLDAWLIENGINLLGSWSGGENSLELSYQNDAKNVALVTWKSSQGTVANLVGGNRKFAVPEKPKNPNDDDKLVAKKLVADGCGFNTDGEREETNVWAEFEFSKAKKTKVTKFSLRICPTSREKFPKHSYALIEVKLTGSKLVSARLFDYDKKRPGDDQQLGEDMTLKTDNSA